MLLLGFSFLFCEGGGGEMEENYRRFLLFYVALS